MFNTFRAIGSHSTTKHNYVIEVINEFPHDPTAFTQGLLNGGNDTLYEFTGLYHQSSVRRVDIQTGELERNLADMPLDEAAKYCQEKDLHSALTKIIKTGFSAINLIYFFTACPDEVKYWQIRRQRKAHQVMKFDDLKELGSEAAVKELISSMVR